MIIRPHTHKTVTSLPMMYRIKFWVTKHEKSSKGLVSNVSLLLNRYTAKKRRYFYLLGTFSDTYAIYDVYNF